MSSSSVSIILSFCDLFRESDESSCVATIGTRKLKAKVGLNVSNSRPFVFCDGFKGLITVTRKGFCGKGLANRLDLMGFSIVSDKDISVCGLDNNVALVVYRDGISGVKCKRLHKYFVDVRFMGVTFLSSCNNVIRTRLRVPCRRRRHISDFSKNETMGSGASVSETARKKKPARHSPSRLVPIFLLGVRLAGKNNLLDIYLAGYLALSDVILSCMRVSMLSIGRTLPSWS